MQTDNKNTMCLVVIVVRRAWRYQRRNQSPQIEEVQTTQWLKAKGETTIYKTYT